MRHLIAATFLGACFVLIVGDAQAGGRREGVSFYYSNSGGHSNWGIGLSFGSHSGYGRQPYRHHTWSSNHGWGFKQPHWYPHHPRRDYGCDRYRPRVRYRYEYQEYSSGYWNRYGGYSESSSGYWSRYESGSYSGYSDRYRRYRYEGGYDSTCGNGSYYADY